MNTVGGGGCSDWSQGQGQGQGRDRDRDRDRGRQQQLVLLLTLEELYQHYYFLLQRMQVIIGRVVGAVLLITEQVAGMKIEEAISTKIMLSRMGRKAKATPKRSSDTNSKTINFKKIKGRGGIPNRS